MVKKSDTALSGMGEIAGYFGRSPTTILQLIRNLGFPARKIGGVWESDKTVIDEWRKAKISESA